MQAENEVNIPKDKRSKQQTIKENKQYLKVKLETFFTGRDSFVYNPVTAITSYNIVLIIEFGKIHSIKKKFPHADELNENQRATTATYQIEGNKNNKQSIIIDETFNDDVFKQSIAEFNNL